MNTAVHFRADDMVVTRHTFVRLLKYTASYF